MKEARAITMSIDAASIAKEFAITEEELTRKSLRSFLLEQLRLVEAERKARCAKFGVKDLWEMDRAFRLFPLPLGEG